MASLEEPWNDREGGEGEGDSLLFGLLLGPLEDGGGLADEKEGAGSAQGVIVDSPEIDAGSLEWLDSPGGATTPTSGSASSAAGGEGPAPAQEDGDAVVFLGMSPLPPGGVELAGTADGVPLAALPSSAPRQRPAFTSVRARPNGGPRGARPPRRLALQRPAAQGGRGGEGPQTDNQRRRRQAAIIGELAEIMGVKGRASKADVLQEAVRRIRESHAQLYPRPALEHDLNTLRGAGVGVFILQMSFNCEPLNANDRFLDFLGVTREELTTTFDASDVCREQDGSLVAAMTELMISGNGRETREMTPWKGRLGWQWLSSRVHMVRRGPPSQHHFLMVGVPSYQRPLSERMHASVEVVNADGTTSIVRL